MNNRLDTLFRTKCKDILSIFFTAGFPYKDSLVEIVETLSAQGVDMVEIGVPFSDPLADGPVIQQSSTQALKNGISLSLILEQVKTARSKVTDIPFVLMGYINPILQYGVERFFSDACDAGIDGVIIPDLPFEIYMKEFKEMSMKYGIHMIMLITPETSDERIRLIDDNCSGFIYMVSSASTTGTKNRFSDEQLAYFRRIDAMKLKHDRLIGFGISNPVTLKAAFENASGAIIGSLFIKCLRSEPDIRHAVDKLLDTLGITNN